MSWLPIALPHRLHRAGVLGINARNRFYIQRYNQRRFYPRADSKFQAKEILSGAGLPTPELLDVIRFAGELARLKERLARIEGDFVIKPDHGSGGKGVLVLHQVEEGHFQRASGREVGIREVKHHLANTLFGLYSLGGQPDSVLIERRVVFDSCFEGFRAGGVPDVRLVVFLGHVAMAMLRLPTKKSGGRANLHQGAVGVGIDLETGLTKNAVSGSSFINSHPDTDEPLQGFKIPHWKDMLEIAERCAPLFKLGYFGVDIVLDQDLGPMILELNVRPGLAIQLANRMGLRHRLEEIEKANKRLIVVGSEEQRQGSNADCELP